MPIEGLDQVKLKPQQLVGVGPVGIDVVLGHVLLASLPFESPKLSATAVMTSNDFATMLEKAIKRTAQVRQIEGTCEQAGE